MEVILNKYFQIIWEMLVTNLSSEEKKHNEIEYTRLNQAPIVA